MSNKCTFYTCIFHITHFLVGIADITMLAKTQHWVRAPNMGESVVLCMSVKAD